MKSGDPAVGTPSLEIESLRAVQLDSSGNATVVAYLDTGEIGITPKGIWTESQSRPLRLIAYEGGPAPQAGPQAVYSRLGDVHSNEKGNIAFTSQMVDTHIVTGLWYVDESATRLIAWSGMEAPGLPAGSFLGRIMALNDSPAFSMNAAGDFAVLIPVTGLGVGLWSGNFATGMELKAVEGQAMPGFADDDTLDRFAYGRTYGTVLGIDADGDITFHGYTRNIGNPTATGPNGLWETSPTGLEVVLREGSSLPSDATSIVSGIFAAGPSSASGVFPVIVRTSNGVNSRVMLSDHGALSEVLGVGQEAPGGGGLPIREFFGSVYVNDSLDVAVIGEYGSTTAVWSNFRSPEMELIIKELGPAPEVVGAVFANSGGTQTVPFRIAVLNENGQLAVQASLERGVGGVTLGSDAGIWASDKRGILRLIVQEGQEVSLAADDRRIIDQISFSDFNDRGQLAFIAYFTDGTSAALVSNLVAIPEPHWIGMLAWISIRAVGRHRNLRPFTGIRMH